MEIKSIGSGITKYEYEYYVSTPSTSRDNIPNLRLLCGFSYKGVFNRPVLVTSVSQFKKIYGDIDRNLEHKGSYFHRSAMIALNNGPILALNLHAYKDLGLEHTKYVGLLNNHGGDIRYSDIFDTSLYYEPSPSKFKDYVRNNNNTDDIFLTNTSTNKYTAFVVKTEDRNEYNVTFEEFFGGEYPHEIQCYINKKKEELDEPMYDCNHKLNEHLYSVYVFKGDWYDVMPSKLKSFITENGGVVKQDIEGNITDIRIPKDIVFLQKLKKLNIVKLHQEYTGLALPDVTDSYGEIVSLENIINGIAIDTDIMCSIPDIICDVDNSDPSSNIRVHSLKALSYGVEPNLTDENQNQILNLLRDKSEVVMTADKEIYGVANIRKALVDKDYTNIRYVVDTFGLGYEVGCKDVYAKLCEARENTFAIVNFPDFTTVKRHNNNKNMYETLNYNLREGSEVSLYQSSFSAYYYPYIRVNDITGGVVTIPPSASVSNNFVIKNSMNKEYHSVAGSVYGKIPMILGVETEISDGDRAYLEDVGVNPLVSRFEGVVIYGNKTAKQNEVTSLSSIHCRETTILVMNIVEDILKNYVFDINNSTTRNEIKNKITNNLDKLKGGDKTLTDYLIEFDESDNTSEIIDNGFGILTLYIELERAYEKIIQKYHIYKRK